MTSAEYRKYATEVAVDIIRQLITLTSSFIVVTATVIKIFFDTNSNNLECFSLAIFSIISGILALGAISTSAHDESEFNLDAPYTRWCMRLQQIFFVIMFLLFVSFSAVNAID